MLRRICSSCKTKYENSDEELDACKVKRSTKLKELRFTQEAIDLAKTKATSEAMPYLRNLTIDSAIGDLAFFRGTGCDKCAGTGLKGRQGVYEVMAMSPAVRKTIMSQAGAAEIKDVAVSEGMLTLRMDAWMKVMKGITTIEQMIRETSA